MSRHPPRRRDHNAEALALIKRILSKTWFDFQWLKPDPSSPSGWRELSKEEEAEKYDADRRAELATAKEAARDGDRWPLVKISLEGELDFEAKKMLGVRALVGIKRGELTEEALQWIWDRWCGRVSKLKRGKSKKGRPKFNDPELQSKNVHATDLLPVIKEIVKEYYDMEDKDLHAWAMKLTAMYFNIDEGGLRSEWQGGTRDPRWKIDLECFRAHLRRVRYSESHLQSSDE